MHIHDNKKQTVSRINRIVGHMNSIKTMVEEDRDCSEVLIQLSAVKSAISGLSKAILEEHIDHCLVEAVANKDEDTIANLKSAIGKMI